MSRAGASQALKFVSDEEFQKVVRPEAMIKRDSIEDEKWR
jgi:hypothetical protein